MSKTAICAAAAAYLLIGIPATAARPTGSALWGIIANETLDCDSCARTVKLVRGRTEFRDDGGLSTVELDRRTIATGDLNGDGESDAAVILQHSGPGSGTFYNLTVMTRHGRDLHSTASVLLGDRVRVRSLRIVKGEVVVELTDQGPTDPMCCPTREMTNRYQLAGKRLEKK